MWLLTLASPERESTELITGTLAAWLRNQNLKIQAPNKSGRVLTPKEGQWRLASTAHVPRITLVTGLPKDPQVDMSEQTKQALTSAGLPEPDDVRWTKAGVRTIVHVLYLTEGHLHCALDRLEQGPIRSANCLFRLAPDLHILQERLKRKGLCTSCGRQDTGQHGFGKCFGAQGLRGLMCWSCGENATNNRAAHFNGACQHGHQLLRDTVSYLRGGGHNHHQAAPCAQPPVPTVNPILHVAHTGRHMGHVNYSHALQARPNEPQGQQGDLSRLLNAQVHAAFSLMEIANLRMQKAIDSSSPDSIAEAGAIVERANALVAVVQALARRL